MHNVVSNSSLTYLGNKCRSVVRSNNLGHTKPGEYFFQDLLYYYLHCLSLSLSFFFPVGKASTQPEKVSTNTSRYLYPYLAGFTSVKSTSQ